MLCFATLTDSRSWGSVSHVILRRSDSDTMPHMNFEPYAARTHEKMKDVLMDPKATGPAIHYHMIRGGSNKRNITIWETGLVGREYIKTYGHYHLGNLDETYWIVAGEGIALLQKMVVEKGIHHPDRIEKFQAMR